MENDGKAQIESIVQRILAVEPAAWLQGYSEEEVAAGEALLGFRLPPVFRAFLLRLGKEAGPLLRGTDVSSPTDLLYFLGDARDLVADSETGFEIPPTAVVFAMHQGYAFVYFDDLAAFDPPVYQYVEEDAASIRIAETLVEFFIAELG